MVGVDLSAAAVELARQRAADDPNVRFFVGDARSVPLEGVFNAVIGRLVLMHFDDPAALPAFATRLRRGGLIVFHGFIAAPAESLAKAIWSNAA